ncbi:RpiR family transcriptional regulator [Enterococcus plantarum]|uniref:MurR/RpiR family transcriptional regulator n=2 Tax=Enterococcus TaxID=1350 RepID=UPI00084E0233|nr:MurR/RpiR family transcriptional regulator [Enterococcus plantarum]MBO0422132.1 MurR/RpiR family transcriptional regulator [Enterococcus plantarum]MBO0466711.1 MurR/RpiR family transcriptional regulator [Enterococcus plantarum]OEG13279.1 RpiR family transcriptional regulator [Enterococcus plantarum]
MNLMLKLKSLDKLTTSEEVLITYILDFPEKVIHFSPKELAEHSYVSISTIYRLINKLDLEGLNDLKFALVNYLNEHTTEQIIDIDYPISAEDNHYAITQKLKSVYNQTVQSTIDTNNLDTIAFNGNLLKQAEFIDVYATSANIYFAQNFQFQLQEIGKQVNVPIDDFMQNLSAANSTPKHLAIVVSYGGRSSSVKKILEILKKNKSKILLVTSKDSPLLNETVDGVFLFSSLENHYNKISSFSTRMSLMYIFDSLYLSFFNQDYDRNLAYKLDNYQKMNPKLI